MIKRAFTEHPASVGESYFQHMGMAFGFGGKMVISGLACLLHGVFPFLFVTTGKDCIKDLHNRMVTHRDRRHAAEASGEAHAQMLPLAREKQSLQAAE